MKRNMLIGGAVLLVLVTVVGYLFWPRKAGADCSRFQVYYEADCLGKSDADASCAGNRKMYNDSIHEHANNEDLCRELNKVRDKYEEDKRKRKNKKETEELYEKMGRPVPDEIKKLWEDE